MESSKICPPIVEPRGEVSRYGIMELKDKVGTVITIHIDAKRGQKWGKLHDALLVDLADVLGTGILD